MKVILNKDVKYLGEEGDVKVVANGYARNYLYPRMLAVPYNDATVALFEGRKADIEARKEQKRKDSASMKEKLEALSLVAEMPAGANGKLYGAVTTLTVADLLLKDGFEVERKKIDIPGVTIKNTGRYHITVKLYEAQVAEIELLVKAQGAENVPEAEKTESDTAEPADESSEAAVETVPETEKTSD